MDHMTWFRLFTQPDHGAGDSEQVVSNYTLIIFSFNKTIQTYHINYEHLQWPEICDQIICKANVLKKSVIIIQINVCIFQPE